VFDALFVPQELRAATSDEAWLQAMLDAERALAVANAAAGVIPSEAATAITEAGAGRLNTEWILEQGGEPGNPVEPLVRTIREVVGGEAADYVHRGATSQDILDTAAMLVARRSIDLLLAELDGVARECASLAETHRDTVMAGRTLLQQAVPITFGLKVAGWLEGILDACRLLRNVRLAAQLGGAAGTLAVLGEAGPKVLRVYAAELELAEPVAPWHTNRARIAELGSALTVTAGALAKIGLDVALLEQTEVAEVKEGAGGASSTMPQKQNPVGSALAVACARLASAHASVLTAALAQEHERAVGAWHAEWPALSGALGYAGGAAAAAARELASLEVDAERMRANIDPSALAERVTFLLAEKIGLGGAREVVAEAAKQGRLLPDALREDERVALSPEELAAAFEPATYLGSSGEFVDRVLEVYRAEVST
jgi:3-carboxy-cis,cis-muconate cycloisomerase